MGYKDSQWEGLVQISVHPYLNTIYLFKNASRNLQKKCERLLCMPFAKLNFNFNFSLSFELSLALLSNFPTTHPPT